MTALRDEPALRPGSMIAEKYRIERELGRGGFGVVLCAIHLALDRRVAIKVLLEDVGCTEAEWEEDAARFRREAKATAALRSSHVVRVLDVDQLETGHPYIVMEFLQGTTLHELVYTKGPLPVDEAVDYVLQVLAALSDAHSAGIVHRDLKPANVILTVGIGGAPLVKVLDFGVSKMISAASQRLTRTGAVVGTVAYMAPEQMSDAKGVDARADIWSAGIMLYEALARNHPFGALTKGANVVTSIVNDPIPSIRSVRPEVPAELEAVIGRMVEKSPARRFASALEVAEALAPFASLRTRPVLDDIRRAPLPTGAAAPPSRTSTIAAISARAMNPKRSLLPSVALVTLLVLAGGIAYAAKWKPEILRGVPGLSRLVAR